MLKNDIKLISTDRSSENQNELKRPQKSSKEPFPVMDSAKLISYHKINSKLVIQMIFQELTGEILLSKLLSLVKTHFVCLQAFCVC